MNAALETNVNVKIDTDIIYGNVRDLYSHKYIIRYYGIQSVIYDFFKMFFFSSLAKEILSF